MLVPLPLLLPLPWPLRPELVSLDTALALARAAARRCALRGVSSDC